MEAFTVDSIETTAAKDAAILFILQLSQRLPIVERWNSLWVAIVAGEIINILTQHSWNVSTTVWLVVILNGLVNAMSAYGGYHVVSKSAKN